MRNASFSNTHTMQDCFLSCDWGTSTFRLRLVQVEGAVVLAELVTETGIAEMHKTWMAEKANKTDRLFFYQSYIHTQIKILEAKTGAALHHVPVLVSGMASSTIGMQELPYKELPFKLDGSDLDVRLFEPSVPLPNQLLLISGAKTGEDVMRGEETLVVGCAVETNQEERVFIFPGTHSKHVWVRRGVAQLFKTYMTGELFDVLSTKSILSNSVERNLIADNDSSTTFFEKGIKEGAASNLLNSIFHVRTAQVFKKQTPKENYHYLSGLLIGAELKDLVQDPPPAICLVCGRNLEIQYTHALAILGKHANVEMQQADLALIRGQLRIYENIKSGHYRLSDT
jgi:2-dehydro-3-deoxygalactonokinase